MKVETDMPRAAQTPSVDASTRRRSLVSFSTILKSMVTLTVAIALSVLAAGGTYAYLNSSRPVSVSPSTGSSATIQSGTSGLVASSNPIAFSGLYPGITQAADFSVTASGSADLMLSVTSITGQGVNGLAITVAPGTCAAPGTAIAAGSLGVKAVAATTYDAVTTPASTVPLCLVVSMLASAPASAAGTTTSLVVNLTGDQP
jgi:predicted ribosomally synthesized peptide with SipW-like signal peptide